MNEEEYKLIEKEVNALTENEKEAIINTLSATLLL